MEQTKSINMEIKGRHGATLANSIQKHLPTDKMIFIRTLNQFTLFCQVNHPIIISRDGIEMTIDAGDIQTSDNIWVDNSIILNESNIVPDISPKVVAKYIYDSFCGKIDESDTPDILHGELHNLRFKPDYIQYSKEWIRELIDYINECYDGYLLLHSFNLLQQLKLMCDRIGVRCSVVPDETLDNVFFYIYFGTHYNESVFIGHDMVLTSYIITKWKHWVYDVKTASNEFMCSCIQTHNSFHTGGAVDIKRADILTMLMENIEDNLDPIIKQNFEQVESELINKSDLATIDIRKNIYVDDNKMTRDTDNILLPVGYFDLKIGNMLIPVTIEQPVKLYIHNNQITETDSLISLTYQKDTKILFIEPMTLSPEDVARMLDRYVGGNSPWTTPESLFVKFYKILSPFGNWDSVHLEVIISNILRWKEDPQLPARVKYPFNPAMFNIKSLPGVMSYPLGICYENYSKSLTTGMISDRGLESPIEKLFYGIPLHEVKK